MKKTPPKRGKIMRIAICDDDAEFAEELREKAANGFSALNAQPVFSVYTDGAPLASGTSDFDAVFLDIDMPEINGFDIAEKINRESECLIVFVTSYDELVYSSIKFRPFRFIRKSYLDDELPEAINALNNAILKRAAGKRFKLRSNNADVFLGVDEIIYIETFGHWLRIYVRDGDMLECYGSLSDMEEQLSGLDFVRTHKSYLVNCRYVYSIARGRVILTDKTEIPLSRYKSDAVKSRIKNYILSEL